MATARTTDERGYGALHQAERSRWRKRIDAGTSTQCACARPDCPHHTGRCPTIIAAGDPFDLGHTDDRQGWTGPECPPCNRSAGGRNAHIGEQMTIREW